MFKKLRNRFLLLNMLIISVMMFIAFFSIYMITSRNVHNRVSADLRRMSEFGFRQERTPGFHPSISNGSQPRDLAPPFVNDDTFPERSVSFFVTTDKDWNISGFSSAFEADKEFYERAIRIVEARNKETGRFRLDSGNWSYLTASNPDGYKTVFLDITPQQAILTYLIYTFLTVALVMLFIIFIISRFFANKAIQPVKNAFDRQEQFIADASHELKTPLAVINTNVDVLLANSEDSIDKQSKWLHYIKSESERMSKLINDLLYLTNMDHSNNKTIYAVFNLSEAVENIILTMEAVVYEHGLSLEYDLEPGLQAYGNSEQIREIVMILLDNAVKYTNTNGLVAISLKKQHNEGVLAVTNTGEGIAEDQIDKIFDRFYRTDKSRSRTLGCYGLGLPIAKAIIEEHGGRLTAKSVVNDKTVFSVVLPLKA